MVGIIPVERDARRVPEIMLDESCPPKTIRFTSMYAPGHVRTAQVTLHVTGNKPHVFQEQQTESVVTEQKGEKHFIHINFQTETVLFERTLLNERHLAHFILVLLYDVTVFIDHINPLAYTNGCEPV
jgi:hypothetical protein